MRLSLGSFLFGLFVCVSILNHLGINGPLLLTRPGEPPKEFGYAHLTHGRVRYRFTPGTGKPVVFVHGLGGTLEVFDTLRAYVEQTLARPTLSFDLHGRGWSDPVFGPGPVAETLSSQLGELLLHLELTKTSKVDVIGLSMGGLVATGFASAFPNIVDKLVLFAPLSSSVNHQSSTWLQPMVRAIPGFLIDHLASVVAPNLMHKTIVAEIFRSNPSNETSEVADFKRAALAQDGRIMGPSIVASVRELDTRKVDELYASKRFPGARVMLVWGVLDKIIPAFPSAENLCRVMSCGKLKLLENTGHYAAVEGKEVFADVAEFLRV